MLRKSSVESFVPSKTSLDFHQKPKQIKSVNPSPRRAEEQELEQILNSDGLKLIKESGLHQISKTIDIDLKSAFRSRSQLTQ